MQKIEGGTFKDYLSLFSVATIIVAGVVQLCQTLWAIGSWFVSLI